MEFIIAKVTLWSATYVFSGQYWLWHHNKLGHPFKLDLGLTEEDSISRQFQKRLVTKTTISPVNMFGLFLHELSLKVSWLIYVEQIPVWMDRTWSWIRPNVTTSKPLSCCFTVDFLSSWLCLLYLSCQRLDKLGKESRLIFQKLSYDNQKVNINWKDKTRYSV